MADIDGKPKVISPHVAYKTLIAFVDSLRRGVPAQIDRSLRRTMSGSAQTQMLASLRFLQMIDVHGNVLVSSGRNSRKWVQRVTP
jgi:hypothetical protein